MHTVFFQSSRVQMSFSLAACQFYLDPICIYHWGVVADLGSNNAWQESGHWRRADLKRTALCFLCWSNFCFFAVNQKYSKKTYGLIACLIGTLQPSFDTSGRFFSTRMTDICIGFTRQASRRISTAGVGGYFCPNSMAFCTNTLEKNPYFSPSSPPNLTALLHLPLRGKMALDVNDLYM